jgi:hypothetical protein
MDVYRTVAKYHGENSVAADIETLRREVHRAIEEVFARHRPAADDGEIDVQAAGEAPAGWTYRWPDGRTEAHDRCEWFRASGSSGPVRVLLAHTRRRAWGEDRERFGVFAQVGRETSRTFYPWTGFVAADDGSFAAPIPDPTRPRSTLKDGDPLPPSFHDARVERTDALYASAGDSPSLRLVVPATDTTAMIRHGYRVAEIRHRVRG